MTIGQCCLEAGQDVEWSQSYPHLFHSESTPRRMRSRFSRPRQNLGVGGALDLQKPPKTERVCPGASRNGCAPATLSPLGLIRAAM